MTRCLGLFGSGLVRFSRLSVRHIVPVGNAFLEGNGAVQGLVMGEDIWPVGALDGGRLYYNAMARRARDETRPCYYLLGQ